MHPGQPTPEEQIRFLNNMQRLLSEGNFVATYKFALLHALADLCVIKGEQAGLQPTLTTREIAEQLIEFYWRQAVPFPGKDDAPSRVLIQNSDRQAAIISKLIAIQGQFPGISLARLKQQTQAWQRLVTEVDEVVRVMPLWKLQTVGSEQLDFLYPNNKGARAITLQPGVAFCFRAFYDLLTDMIRGAWIRLVRNYNADLLGDTADLSTFLFGSERSSLALYREVLLDIQQERCLYCGSRLRPPIEVDHFIPWRRYPVDLAHNFVLAHGTCNRAKSDHLAAEQHLDAWCRRNYEHAEELTRRFDAAGLLHSIRTSIQVAHWAYFQVARLGGQVWVAGDTFKHLQDDWENLLIPAA